MHTKFNGSISVTFEPSGVKHIMKVKPKKTALGKVAAASTADVSGEYAVSYYAMPAPLNSSVMYSKSGSVTSVVPRYSTASS